MPVKTALGTAPLLVPLVCMLLSAAPPEPHLIVLDPGHSHAAAMQSSMLTGFSSEAHVYAPLGPDLTAFLTTITRYNQRASNPTHWSLLSYAGADYLAKMLQEQQGNLVVMAGRNENKIDAILASIQAGQHVLADKPWIIHPAELPKLEAALTTAEQKHLAVYDCMTLRFEPAYQVQRELVNDVALFGRPIEGSPQRPAVELENLHALLKYSGGLPSRRPAWFFDTRQQGEGIADVGTHLVDIMLWTLFPEQSLDYKRDIQILRAEHWPTVLTLAQFEKVTGEPAWPAFVRNAVVDDHLQYFANNSALVTVRGIHMSIRSRWEYEAQPGAKDTYFTIYRGSRAAVRLRAGREQNYVPQVDLIPNTAAEHAPVLAALQKKIETLQSRYPGLAAKDGEGEIRLIIPPSASPGTDSFTLLVKRFLGYLHDPNTLPAWEKSYMLAKYSITTGAVEAASQTSVSSHGDHD